MLNFFVFQKCENVTIEGIVVDFGWDELWGIVESHAQSNI